MKRGRPRATALMVAVGLLVPLAVLAALVAGAFFALWVISLT